jgi:GNAT superfamily N-acetyltransferase
MIPVRAARAEDASAIAHVHVESWRTTYAGIVPEAYLADLDEMLRARLWQGWLAGDTLVLVAERDGQVVGFAHAGTNREGTEGPDAELYSLYLLREAQRRGTGTALLRSIAEALLDRGFRSMVVWVLERNPSRNFYEKMGAHLSASKVIEIGGARLMEVSYEWPDLRTLVPTKATQDLPLDG